MYVSAWLGHMSFDIAMLSALREKQALLAELETELGAAQEQLQEIGDQHHADEDRIDQLLEDRESDDGDLAVALTEWRRQGARQGQLQAVVNTTGGRVDNLKREVQTLITRIKRGN